MNRVVFVGMCNKKGFAPLDSKSKSGKLIDKVIAELQCELDMFGWEFLKTNLYDQEGWPNRHYSSDIYDWASRVEYTGDDIVIVLGQSVRDVFSKGTLEFIGMGHPSAVWSNEKQKEYIKRSRILVASVIRARELNKSLKFE